MRKIFSVTASALITTALLYGCGPRETKVSSDAISAPTQNSNIQVENMVPGNGSNATSSATVPSITNKPNTIEKVNGAERYYIAKPVNILEDDWLINFAGGRNNTIAIRIGQVIYDDNLENTETYIELESKGIIITLIRNGAHYEYEDGTYQIKRITMDFLTGKKLLGKEVVKDYSGEQSKTKIVLIVDYNENGVASQSVIFCSQNDSEDIPENNYYELEVKD